MGLKILHSADWHLGAPLLGFTPEQRAFLKRELDKIPGKVADICRREGCDLVLLAGDLLDHPRVTGGLDGLKAALADCGVPVLIAPGNHDYLMPGSVWLEERWPENVYIFRGGLESVVLEALNCRVYGAGYTAMDCPGLLEGFRAEGGERYCMAVLHGDPVQLKSPYCPVTASQVRDSGLDYLALGHIHKRGAFVSGGTVCGWPGSPMGRGWDETGEKGVYLAELGGRAEVRFLPLDTPKFWEMAFDSISALEDALDPRGNLDFYRITLTGIGGEPVQHLYEKYPNMTIRDRRKSKADLWETAGEDTLAGTFFRILQAQKADPQMESRADLAAEIARKLLAGEEVDLP